MLEVQIHKLPRSVIIPPLHNACRHAKHRPSARRKIAFKFLDAFCQRLKFLAKAIADRSASEFHIGLGDLLVVMFRVLLPPQVSRCASQRRDHDHVDRRDHHVASLPDARR